MNRGVVPCYTDNYIQDIGSLCEPLFLLLETYILSAIYVYWGLHVSPLSFSISHQLIIPPWVHARIRYAVVRTWWRHPMETFSTLLDLYEGNPPVTDGFPSLRPVTQSFVFSLICAWTNGWANNRDAGDLRCHRAHYDFTVIIKTTIVLSSGTVIFWRQIRPRAFAYNIHQHHHH